MFYCGGGIYFLFFFFFQAEDGIRDLVRSRGLGDVYKRQIHNGQDNDEGGYSEENADDGDEGDDGNEDLLPLRPQISHTDEEFIGHSVALSNLPGVSSGERG